VRAGGRTWTRQVQPAASYLASGDPRVHFGLGLAGRADVTVRWPDGRTIEQRGVAPDQYVTVVEGAAGAPVWR
jgi:hypothetical protein